MVLGEGYKFRHCTSNNRVRETYPLKKIHIYKFRNRKDTVYIVHVEEYELNFFAIKFFLQKHRLSKSRYKFLTYEYDARNILDTCIRIGLEVLNKYPNASFGFLGMPTPTEDKRPENEKYFNTKRHRTYLSYTAFFFNPDSFTFHVNKGISSYFLINKQQENLNPNLLNKILDMFTDNYKLEQIFI